jgi:hypothetical protein
MNPDGGSGIVVAFDKSKEGKKSNGPSARHRDSD